MDLYNTDYKITKPLRLIELFAGYGSQALALKKIGIPFEHHFVCEFDKYAVKSYNAVHGTNYTPLDIRNITGKDLNIKDTDKYCYLMTYSFPCTDLSVAGKMKGMRKGSGTRSGLLWEVERLLNECEALPQILFMENVPQVIAKKNIDDFKLWLRFLESKGYNSHYQVLNAKDYGIPQNRNRCFMFSFLGNYDYIFPTPVPLKRKLKDILEEKVDEKYYINSDRAKKLIESFIQRTENREQRTEKLSILPTQEVNTSQYHRQLQQDIMPEYASTKKKELVYLNARKIYKVNCSVAKTLCARDYKGFGTGFASMNGVIEKK